MTGSAWTARRSSMSRAMRSGCQPPPCAQNSRKVLDTPVASEKTIKKIVRGAPGDRVGNERDAQVDPGGRRQLTAREPGVPSMLPGHHDRLDRQALRRPIRRRHPVDAPAVAVNQLDVVVGLKLGICGIKCRPDDRHVVEPARAGDQDPFHVCSFPDRAPDAAPPDEGGIVTAVPSGAISRARRPGASTNVATVPAADHSDRRACAWSSA